MADAGENENNHRDQTWIDEAIASGSATPLNMDQLDAICDRVLNPKKQEDTRLNRATFRQIRAEE